MLLDQEQLAFEAWRDSLETVPTIKVRRTDLLQPFMQLVQLLALSTCCEHERIIQSCQPQQ